MNHPIYYLISVVIGTSIILILIRLTSFVSDENFKAMEEEKLMMNYVITQEILEYHLKKIGYRAGNHPIMEADSQKIKFVCDDNNDGIIDLLELKLGEPAINSENPFDYKLILIKNGNQEIIASEGVTRFKLEFFDVNGNPTNEKMFIKSIRISLKISSSVQIEGNYLFFESHFLVKPKNLV